MVGLDWYKTIQTAASLGAVLLAALALKNWKRQDRAKREAEFLDQLVEASQDYVTQMPKAIEILRLARIGIVCHASPYDENAEPSIEAAITYITKGQFSVSDELRVTLAEIHPSVIRLKSLGDKGQIFRFSDYFICLNSIAQLTWSHGRINAFHTIVASPAMNWNNPSVRESLEAILKIDPVQIQSSISEEHIKVLTFVRKTYKKLYS